MDDKVAYDSFYWWNCRLDCSKKLKSNGDPWVKIKPQYYTSCFVLDKNYEVVYRRALLTNSLINYYNSFLGNHFHGF